MSRSTLAKRPAASSAARSGIAFARIVRPQPGAPMEMALLGVALLLAIPAAAIAGVVMAVGARNRLNLIEPRLRALELRLDSLQAGARAPEPPPAAAPSAPEPAAPTTSVPVSTPAQAK